MTNLTDKSVNKIIHLVKFLKLLSIAKKLQPFHSYIGNNTYHIYILSYDEEIEAYSYGNRIGRQGVFAGEIQGIVEP